jgi:hypothetical protein
MDIKEFLSPSDTLRAADSIDRERRDCDRQPGMDGGLPGGVRASLHDIAHDNGFHLVGAKLRAGDRGAHRHSTETGSRHVLEAAAKGADSGANRFCDNALSGIGMAAAGFGPILGAIGRQTPVEWRSSALGIATAGGSFGQFAIDGPGQEGAIAGRPAHDHWMNSPSSGRIQPTIRL